MVVDASRCGVTSNSKSTSTSTYTCRSLKRDRPKRRSGPAKRHQWLGRKFQRANPNRLTGQPNGTAIRMMSRDLTGRPAPILNLTLISPRELLKTNLLKKLTNLPLGYQAQVGGQPNSALGSQAASTKCHAIPKKCKHLGGCKPISHCVEPKLKGLRGGRLCRTTMQPSGPTRSPQTYRS
jgi:hypothetical protein